MQFTLDGSSTLLTVHPYLEPSASPCNRDYSGEVAERRILGRLLAMIRREMPTFKRLSCESTIYVEGTRADIVAREVYRRMRRPDGKISLSDIEGVL